MLRHLPLLLICFLPFCACLGHDLYLFFKNSNQQFLLLSIGNIWAVYSPDTLSKFIGVLAKENESYVPKIESILEIRITLVALIAGIFVFAAIALEYSILRILFSWVGCGNRGVTATRQQSFRKKMHHRNI